MHIHWCLNLIMLMNMDILVHCLLGMLKKMKKPHARVIAGIACAAMLAINMLSLRISSIVLMLIAAAFGAIMYAVHKKGGTNA